MDEEQQKGLQRIVRDLNQAKEDGGDDHLPCPPPIPFHEVLINEAETSVTEADLKVANFQLQFINAAWPHVHSISALSKMVDTTIKATIHRRNLLKMSYGAENKGPRHNTFEPLD